MNSCDCLVFKSGIQRQEKYQVRMWLSNCSPPVARLWPASRTSPIWPTCFQPPLSKLLDCLGPVSPSLWCPSSAEEYSLLDKAFKVNLSNHKEPWGSGMIGPVRETRTAFNNLGRTAGSLSFIASSGLCNINIKGSEVCRRELSFMWSLR